MVLLNRAPVPVQDRVIRLPKKITEAEASAGMLSDTWIEFFNSLTDTINVQPTRINRVALTLQAAAIAATDFTDGTSDGGLFRVTWYHRVTQPATVSSAVGFTLGWTDGGVPITYTWASLATNVTNDVQSQTLLIASDRNAPITYAESYASVGATPMKYKLELVLEQIVT